MRRIYIFGSSGVGKTTLGIGLSKKLGIPFYELDAINHQANWQPIELDEFRLRVTEIVAADSWVIDGAYSPVRDLILERADTLIFMDYSRFRVLTQLLRRTIKRSIAKTELWNGNRERFLNLFSFDENQNILLWSMRNFQKRRLQSIAIELDHALPADTRIRFKQPQATATWLNNL